MLFALSDVYSSLICITIFSINSFSEACQQIVPFIQESVPISELLKDLKERI